MKINFKIFAFMAIASFCLSACGDDDEESCQNDDGICTVDVTVCCTEGSDDYKYTVGGNEYNNLEDALKDSECAASASPDGKAQIRKSLENLTARARANS